MDTAMDSDDQNSIAIAHVPTGAQAGAKFYSGQNRLCRRWYSNSLHRHGAERSAVESMRMAGFRLARGRFQCNNRWFSRIILPAVANGLGRTGQLYADSTRR